MDYEKLYKEAIERVKELSIDGYLDAVAVESIFPELAESEDERIRKTLIRFHKSTIDIDGIKGEDILAWLEKQGQVKENQILQHEDTREDASCKENDNSLTREPKFKVKYAVGEYNVYDTKDIAGVTFYGIEDEPNHIDYVKAENCEIISGYGIKESGLSFPIKPVMFSEKKSAWSEEDEKRVTNTLSVLSVQVCWDGATGEKKNPYQKEINWLKSLKQRLGG